MTATIEKNIPLPAHAAGGRGPVVDWEAMEPGDSFKYPGKRRAAAALACQRSARMAPRKFKAFDLKTEIRIWRVA